MFFREVIGQQEVAQKLIHSVLEGRIPHAQMFFGPEGTGKLALALAYAQYLNCTERTGEDSCGTCSSCLKYQKLIHPDLHFVFPVIKVGSNRAVSDNHIREWREQILELPYFDLNKWLEKIGSEDKQGSIYTDESSEIIRKLSLKTFEAEWKVMIIWLPEKMHPVASNKLLKILEEPPQQTVFLLVSENTQLILPTILSRVQMIRIPRISDEEITKALRKNGSCPEERIQSLVSQANGNYARAIELLKSDETNENFNRFVSIMRMAWKGEVLEMLGWVEAMASLGREKQKEFLMFSLRMIRENLMLNLKQQSITHLADHEKEFSLKFSAYITPTNVFSLQHEFSMAHGNIEGNGYDRVIFLDLALKISRLLKKAS